jgi:hypothetical protein
MKINNCVAKGVELEASIIVVLTDLMGVFGQPPKTIPVIWAVPQQLKGMSAPFGRVVTLDR